MSAFAPVLIAATTPARGSGEQDDLEFHGQTFQISTSWGSAPGRAIITYVAEGDPIPAPVTSGAEITITIEGRNFWGICISDVTVDGTSGRNRTLEFADFREYLGWDYVFCVFNQPDVRLVGQQRVKRYKHLYPADYFANVWTYTDAPLTAAQILDAMFSAGTVLSPWGRIYHDDQIDFPVFDINCHGGKPLAAAVQEVSDKQGLVFTIGNAPYQLLWVRKGFGAVPGFPTNADDRKLGSALSGNATRVWVIGEPNVYQLMNVNLTLDWAYGWEQFLVQEVFDDDIYRRASDPLTGIRFNATPNDAEQIIGRTRAAAYARQITVRQYVALRNAVSLPGDTVNGNAFFDHRKFHGRSRMDMPAALYIRHLLFRAFRPALAGFTNYYGEFVPMEQASIVDRQLTQVTHHPPTGLMSTVPGELADGNGYAVVKGYNLGRDLFQTLRPEQFDLNWFSAGRAFWAHTPFQIDDAGDGTRFFVFDEPVFTSEKLLTLIDGKAVIRADFALSVPLVAATFCVEAERYNYTSGELGRDYVENAGGLRGEFIEDGAGVTEVPFADGRFVDEKADEIAEALLGKPFLYAHGSYRVAGTNSTPLTPIIDRVSVTLSPQGGVQETVDFTKERAGNAHQPERDFDRVTRESTLLPGEAELRQEANQFKLLSAAFRQSPEVIKNLSDLFGGRIGSNDGRFQTVFVKPGGTGVLAAGTPLRAKSPAASADPRLPSSQTTAVIPALATSEDKLFAGVTVRHNEPVGRSLRVQTAGTALVRVMGPVVENGSVGLGPLGTEAHLVSGGSTSVGLAQEKIAAAEVKLIPVRLGAGGGARRQFRLVSIQNDFYTCKAWTGTEEVGEEVYIARPFEHRLSNFHGQTIAYNSDGDSFSATYSYTSATKRTKTIAGVDEIQVLIPLFKPGFTIIYASPVDYPLTAGPSNTPITDPNGQPITLLDDNRDGRAWTAI